ncbi:helix-turn-helix transcriptional regulator [bacterium]|nr:helix-turn-helix transcriptional regulator [bacterium]
MGRPKKRQSDDFRDYLNEQLRDPEFAAGFEEASEDLSFAVRIIELRTAMGLSQKQLADKLGTTQSVISRIENSNYQGHSLKTLRKVADALDARVVIDIVPKEEMVKRARSR